MRDRCRQLSEACALCRTRELLVLHHERLHCPVSTLLRLLLLAQVQCESDALHTTIFEQRSRNQDGNTATVLTPVFLLVWRKYAAFLYVRHRPLVLRTPLSRRQGSPPSTTGRNVFVVIPHHVEKCLIASGDLPVQPPGKDSHDIGVEKPPKPCFANC